MTDRPLPPAGWYRDPPGQFAYRYWNGEHWTDAVSDKAGEVRQVPLPVEGAAEAWEALEDRRGTWSGWVALVAVGAALLSIVVGGLLAGLGAEVNSVTALVGGGTGLYGGMFLTCWLVSRRKGTGNFVTDFGLGYLRGDWWRGAVVSLLGRLAAVIATVILFVISEDLAGSNTAGFDDHKDSLGFLVAAALLAVVAAPFFEELFFRGLVQRSLENSLPAPVAVGGQALLFGLAHLGGGEGWGNVGVVLATAAAGVLFGLAARRYRRLGPSMTGHAWFNLLPVVILFATR